MPRPFAEILEEERARVEARNADISYRFMRLFHEADRAGVKIAVVAYPKDASGTPIDQFRVVGTHVADLDCSLDIAEAYIVGLKWRDVPSE